VQLVRALGGLAIAIALVILLRRSGDGPSPAELARTDASHAPAGRASTGPRGAVASGAARPSLPGDPPFRDQDFTLTTDMPEGPVVVLRSSARSGHDLAIELAIREPLAEGKRVFAIVSVSDGLGNTVMDCTWRDVELTDDGSRKLDCELPADVALPLTISGHQLPGPSFVESPQVVAMDRNAQ